MNSDPLIVALHAAAEKLDDENPTFQSFPDRLDVTLSHQEMVQTMKLADALSYFVLKAPSTRVTLPPRIRSGVFDV